VTPIYSPNFQASIVKPFLADVQFKRAHNIQADTPVITFSSTLRKELDGLLTIILADGQYRRVWSAVLKILSTRYSGSLPLSKKDIFQSMPSSVNLLSPS
jgi:hypothetical protein